MIGENVELLNGLSPYMTVMVIGVDGNDYVCQNIDDGTMWIVWHIEFVDGKYIAQSFKRYKR